MKLSNVNPEWEKYDDLELIDIKPVYAADFRLGEPRVHVKVTGWEVSFGRTFILTTSDLGKAIDGASTDSVDQRTVR